MLNCSESPRLARARDAQFAMASLVCPVLRVANPLCPGSASIASELAGQVTAIGCPGSKSP